jgi:Domain of unknown function (DUF4249)
MMMDMRNCCKPCLIFLSVLLMLTDGCRKTYNPPAIQVHPHFLAVDGFINTGARAISSFTLTRSRNLLDSDADIFEYNAQVSIHSSDGNSFSLLDTFGTGIYSSGPLTLDTTRMYQLVIITADGNVYASDLVPPKPAPPVDSVNWTLGVNPGTDVQVVRIYVSSHDPKNATHYYRWDFLEIYEHKSLLQTFWGESNGYMFPFQPPDNIHVCFTTVPSASILLGSSIALSQDVISHAFITELQQNDRKMDIGYSILVRQYPLTADAYNYWLNVQHNSQSLGGLYDLQPSQISGNIHSITQPADSVLGYVTAGSVSENRLFISNKSLYGWRSNPFYSCPLKVTGINAQNYLIYDYPDTTYAPYYYSGAGLVIAPKICVDCRADGGGTTIKPDYWPE